MKLILFVLVFLFSWATVHGGTRKKMPEPPKKEGIDEVQV